MSTKKKLIIIASLAVFIACMFLLCGKAKADEIKGQFFLPISARYIEDLGVAGGVGYRFNSGLILMGQVSYDHFNATTGTATCTINCRNCQAPFTVPASGHRGIEFTVGIPISKRKK